MCLSQFLKNYRAKVFAPGYTSSYSNKGLRGIRCHYTATIWHKFPSPASLGEKKKIIGLIIFHLFGILHSLFYTKTASMSPVTWEAELRLHRLTVAPWKAPVFDVTTMPHQPPVLGIEHGRLSRGCLSAKWLLAHWLSRRGGEVGEERERRKGTSTVGEEMGRRRREWKEGGPSTRKSMKSRMTAWWGREREGNKEKGVPQWEASPCWLLWLEAAADGFKRAPGSLGLRF